MVVVSDSSAIIHLARIGHFHLLKTLYGRLAVASGVYSEVVERGWGLPGSSETEKAVREGWIQVRSVSDRARALQIMRQYGINYANAETVQLAQEARAELTLADEAEVRELVEEQGLRVRGCIGVLIEAAKRGVISRDEAKEAIARLVESGYRVSEKVLRLAHKLIGD